MSMRDDVIVGAGCLNVSESLLNPLHVAKHSTHWGFRTPLRILGNLAPMPLFFYTAAWAAVQDGREPEAAKHPKGVEQSKETSGKTVGVCHWRSTMRSILTIKHLPSPSTRQQRQTEEG
jgi:hypothetical protein